jgi:hypothetical protein
MHRGVAQRAAAAPPTPGRPVARPVAPRPHRKRAQPDPPLPHAPPPAPSCAPLPPPVAAAAALAAAAVLSAAGPAAARQVCLDLPDGLPRADMGDLLHSPWAVLALAILAVGLLPRILQASPAPGAFLCREGAWRVAPDCWHHGPYCRGAGRAFFRRQAGPRAFMRGPPLLDYIPPPVAPICAPPAARPPSAGC